MRFRSCKFNKYFSKEFLVSNQIDRYWHWQTGEKHSYLTCELLSTWQHGFFSRESYPHPPEKLTSILEPGSLAYRVKQVHGNSVVISQEIANATANNPIDSLLEGDGVISDRPKQSVWVASADCTPVLIGDVVTGRVCAIHAGWRGTAAKIVPEAIAKFLRFGSQKQNLRIAIGPAISGEVYQVDESVAAKVGRTIISDAEKKADIEIITKLKQLANSPILDDKMPGKVRLNVPLINQIQLEQLGVNSEHIAIAQECTYKHSDRFFSYRRSGEKKVQWSGIVSR